MNGDPTGSGAGGDRDWTTAPLEELIHHLSIDEHNWFRAELSSVGQLLAELSRQHGAEFPALTHLPPLFAQLCRDLETHMHHEEEELFPAISRYLTAIAAGQPLKGSPLNAFGGPLRVMEHEHETTGAALRLLREFSLDYAIPGDSCEAYTRAMERLANLEDRLLNHVYLENNVLYPRAVALKSARTPTSAKV